LLYIFPENLNTFQQILFELLIFALSNWTAGHSSALRVTSNALSQLGLVQLSWFMRRNNFSCT